MKIKQKFNVKCEIIVRIQALLFHCVCARGGLLQKWQEKRGTDVKGVASGIVYFYSLMGVLCFADARLYIYLLHCLLSICAIFRLE